MLLLAASPAVAQSKSGPAVIGWLHMSSRASEGPELAAFREGLAALGWKEGSQFVIEERWAEGRIERLQPLADDLARKAPAVIVSWPTQPIRAALKAMPAVPVVQVAAADPVVTGFAASMARPGGMVTGLSNIVTDTNEKLLELLLAAVPDLKRVGFLADSTNFARARLMETARSSAARLKVEAAFAEPGKPEDIEPAMARLAPEKAQALIVMASPLFVFERRRIMKLALQHRWPVAAARQEFVEEGALLAYGIDVRAQFRRAATYVDKILKGARAGDLPIEQPMTLTLVLSQKTAKALGITIPPSLLLRADRVIE
jgi:putative ABC transport system substrate-binding protein